MSKDDKKKIYKPRPISGYPEWLPELRRTEQLMLDKIRSVYESYGYCNIETPAVEELEVIAAKGEDVDKEIYVLERLQADPDDKKEARLALHFDQTVPFARYVAMNFNELTFPFKRYQMQKVWRGERPQMGRMREFYQCDIDVINVDALPLSFDAEVAAICYEALEALNIGRVQLRISNRKILSGLLESMGVTDILSVTRAIDKLGKIPTHEIMNIILDSLIDHPDQATCADIIHDFALIKASYSTFEEKINNFIIDKKIADNSLNNEALETMREGIEELSFVMEQLSHLPDDAAIADLSIVRGLDYYTGTVYETQLLDVPEFTGSVCSGGRYDDLAGSYINKKLPGVGISIGFSRLFDVLSQLGHIQPSAKSPAHVLMVLPSEDKRKLASDTARAIRSRGYNVELYHAPQKIKKQMAYAEKKGIPFVWFPPFEDGGVHEVKCMETGTQTGADPDSWTPEQE